MGVYAYFLEYADPLDVWQHSRKLLGAQAISDILYGLRHRCGAFCTYCSYIMS